MGRKREATATCFSANACVCKTLSIFLIVISIVLIIAGSVMIGQHKGYYWGNSFDDDWMENNSKYGYGIGILGTGIVIFMAAMVMACCSFQLKLLKGLLKSNNGEEIAEQRSIFRGPAPEAQAPGGPSAMPYLPTQPYPPETYPGPPPPAPSAQPFPPNAFPTLPPRIPPSYEEASSMPTAPVLPGQFPGKE